MRLYIDTSVVHSASILFTMLCKYVCILTVGERLYWCSLLTEKDYRRDFKQPSNQSINCRLDVDDDSFSGAHSQKQGLSNPMHRDNGQSGIGCYGLRNENKLQYNFSLFNGSKFYH